MFISEKKKKKKHKVYIQKMTSVNKAKQYGEKSIATLHCYNLIKILLQI